MKCMVVIVIALGVHLVAAEVTFNHARSSQNLVDKLCGELVDKGLEQMLKLHPHLLSVSGAYHSQEEAQGPMHPLTMRFRRFPRFVPVTQAYNSEGEELEGPIFTPEALEAAAADAKLRTVMARIQAATVKAAAARADAEAARAAEAAGPLEAEETDATAAAASREGATAAAAADAATSATEQFQEAAEKFFAAAEAAKAKRAAEALPRWGGPEQAAALAAEKKIPIAADTIRAAQLAAQRSNANAFQLAEAVLARAEAAAAKSEGAAAAAWLQAARAWEAAARASPRRSLNATARAQAASSAAAEAAAGNTLITVNSTIIDEDISEEDTLSKLKPPVGKLKRPSWTQTSQAQTKIENLEQAIAATRAAGVQGTALRALEDELVAAKAALTKAID
eukprot:gnl/MRDRNA2_/MRDRNA2_64070_c0_seq2.p1 gnl/MRDRNA2_/MRDRNA2_64070_c0~~gnl/MRDRNA2_/MRDRNA2_64070_c0_seq2.p1  ORF type:complete len:395 (+),score=147.81 gnl/MRDRNA2_/MRDRNA2_64070_c0_seq2:115-1299(+)